MTTPDLDEKRVRRRGCLRDLALIGISVALGAILALAILFSVNGALDFGRTAGMITVKSDLDAMNATLQNWSERMETQAQQIDDLTRRVEELERQAKDILVGSPIQ